MGFRSGNRKLFVFRVIWVKIVTSLLIAPYIAIFRSEQFIITDHLHRHVVELSDNLYLLANGETYQVRDMEQLAALGYMNTL